MTKSSLATKKWREDFKRRDPEGYKTYRRTERQKYVKKYCKRISEARNQTTAILRREVHAAYGNKCECCNESRAEFLTIDHIDGRGYYGPEGNKRKRGDAVYRWLKRHNWPKDDYRLLCMNCNWAIGVHGHCPHQFVEQRAA